MPESPIPELWQEIDGLLCLSRASGDINMRAFQRYREIMGCGINAAVEALDARRQYLVKTVPERFAPEPDLLQISLDKLRTIREKILVIEANWNDDSVNLVVDIYAIIDAPSPQHPKYGEVYLVEIPETRNTAAEAERIGGELARTAGVPFVFFPKLEYPKSRWWNQNQGSN